jgi:aspartyl-tRNA(Asn)/glutamyl-tRNA(Gln) amidotransferase subunit B
MKNYIATIGIECHVQLKTKTKLFAAVANDARDAAPNTLINHICLGMPGALPVLNKSAVELAARASFALGVEPQVFSKFDRKHYFYPDLPKGYQISQYDQPIILGGYVDIVVDGEAKRIQLTRAHLEEDAGKSTHPEGRPESLVDLNRAGTPLLEIVSEPVIHTAKEAKAYAKELYLLMKYADVSDVDLYYGNMRFDVNVSISSNETLGTRTETKNLNSFKSVEKAIEYEIARQTEMLEKGEEIVQETRGWNDDKQCTFSQRSKENAHDYRYFPDPDIPPIILSQEFIESIKKTMPLLPADIRQKLQKLRLEKSQIDTIIEEPAVAYMLADMSLEFKDSVTKNIAHWISGECQRLVSEGVLTWGKIINKKKALCELSQMVEDAELSSTAAKEVLIALFTSEKSPEQIAEEKNLLQQSDESELELIVDEIIAANPSAVNDVQNGEMKAVGFLVGQTMKLSGGKANPGLVTVIIKKRLGV